MPSNKFTLKNWISCYSNIRKSPMTSEINLSPSSYILLLLGWKTPSARTFTSPFKWSDLDTTTITLNWEITIRSMYEWSREITWKLQSMLPSKPTLSVLMNAILRELRSLVSNSESKLERLNVSTILSAKSGELSFRIKMHLKRRREGLRLLQELHRWINLYWFVELNSEAV